MGKKDLICSCKDVSLKELVEYIQKHPGCDFKEVSKKTKAGTGCGKCRRAIRALIAKPQSLKTCQPPDIQAKQEAFFR